MSDSSNESLFDESDVIYRYTRAQAVADGVLVDLSKWAREVGFRYPVACTTAVWADINAIPTSREGCEDVRGRAHDVLTMAALAARRGGTQTLFKVRLNVGRQRMMEYRLACGPGDDAEPVITLLKPDED